ncbi:unnamed protein product [Orchesella dallaii]|uniref:BTB domain-containing protein n=1 Tax=Orchesella dallaii TaxID=48710 RepID=A0ABP1RRX8_9HEXA
MECSLLKVQWKAHTNVLADQLSHRLSQQQFVDVELLCESKTIKCHRLVLAANSLFFYRVLSEHPRSDLVLTMEGMKYSVLEALVTFIYTGEVTVSQGMLNDLIMAAEKLEIKGLSNVFGITDAARSGGGGGVQAGSNAGSVLNEKRPKSGRLSQPRKPRYILPKVMEEEAEGMRRREMDPPQMPTLLKRPNVDQPNHVGAIPPTGLMTSGLGAQREVGVTASGVGIGGPFSGGAAGATNNAVIRLNESINKAHHGSAFAGKNNQIPRMNGPSSTLLTTATTQSGIQVRQFLENAGPRFQPIASSSSSMETQRQPRMNDNVELDREKLLKKAALKAIQYRNIKRAAAEFNIPRTSLSAYIKRREKETAVPQVVMQDEDVALLAKQSIQVLYAPHQSRHVSPPLPPTASEPRNFHKMDYFAGDQQQRCFQRFLDAVEQGE